MGQKRSEDLVEKVGSDLGHQSSREFIQLQSKDVVLTCILQNTPWGHWQKYLAKRLGHLGIAF